MDLPDDAARVKVEGMAEVTVKAYKAYLDARTTHAGQTGQSGMLDTNRALVNFRNARNALKDTLLDYYHVDASAPPQRPTHGAYSAKTLDRNGQLKHFADKFGVTPQQAEGMLDRLVDDRLEEKAKDLNGQLRAAGGKAVYYYDADSSKDADIGAGRTP